MRTRLLVTGFEPFGGHTANPSQRMVRLLADAPPAGTVLSTRILPVAYRRALAVPASWAGLRAAWDAKR